MAYGRRRHAKFWQVTSDPELTSRQIGILWYLDKTGKQARSDLLERRWPRFGQNPALVDLSLSQLLVRGVIEHDGNAFQLTARGRRVVREVDRQEYVIVGVDRADP